MEENKIQNIESVLKAFRAINTFWYLKGPYPKNSSADFWSEEDYHDEASRRIMRSDFETHLQLLADVHNSHIKTLYNAMSNIESEYNSLVVNARNMEQAMNLFKNKFEKAMFALENECDHNHLLTHYLTPLMRHGIITMGESAGYQDLVSRIVLFYTDAVNVVCSVFHLERPWNKMTVDSDKELPKRNSESEQNDDQQTTNQKEDITPEIVPTQKVIDNENNRSSGNVNEINNLRAKNRNKGRKPAFNHLIEPTISGIVKDETGILQLGIEVSQYVISELSKESRPDKVVALTLALEICGLIPSLEEKKSAYFKILQKETGIGFVLKTFSNKYKEFCDKEHNYKERAKILSNHNGQKTDLNLIIDYKNRFQEIKMKYKKEA